MRLKHTSWTNKFGITRRQLITAGFVGLAGWMLSPVRITEAAWQDELDLVSLIPGMDERDGPLLELRKLKADPDVEVEQHLRLQLSQRKDLLIALKKKIGLKKQVKLSLENIQVRLMFVPQLQEGHAAVYHHYCRDVTDYLFDIYQADNFYSSITSPTQSNPPVATTGISAFLVHRLAKEYRAVCRFTAESGRHIKYNATGAIFSNHLGAVDLEIQLLSLGRYGLKRKPFTVWQNNTQDLYTLMSVPVEETLHYHLGKATDHEIAVSMQERPPENLHAARRMAEEWIAVEESVVGGLVKRVLKHYCNRHQLALSLFGFGDTHPAVPALPQYRYRNRGIQLVQRLGSQEAVAMYMDSPARFRNQLLRQQDA